MFRTTRNAITSLAIALAVSGCQTDSVQPEPQEEEESAIVITSSLMRLSAPDADQVGVAGTRCSQRGSRPFPTTCSRSS